MVQTTIKYAIIDASFIKGAIFLELQKIQDKDLLWKLFKSTFIISAFTIGGGFVIIPLLKANFVDEYR